MSERKQRTRTALIERYNGKKDLLEAWEQDPLPSTAIPDQPYIDNLRRRVRAYSLELTYRGVDEFVEMNPRA